MKRIYRGHEIEVEKEESLGGDENIYYSIFRLDDLFELSTNFKNARDTTVRKEMERRKRDVDRFIEDDSWRDSYEPDPSEYDLSYCQRLDENVQRQLPDQVRNQL